MLFVNLQDICKNEGEDEFLKKLVFGEFVEIINKRWVLKLGENKVKEMVEKYDCFENCEKFFVFKVNFEIWE